MATFIEQVLTVGGLTGSAALILHLTHAVQGIRHLRRRPLLRIAPYDAGRDQRQFEMHAPAPVEWRRFITVQVENLGRRFAKSCVAFADAWRVDGVGGRLRVPLHWADQEPSFNSTGVVPVDIAPSWHHRLDVAFTRSSTQDRPCAWLASHVALRHQWYGDSVLTPGEWCVRIRVTFEDGNEAATDLRIVVSDRWDYLRADPLDAPAP